MSKERGPPHLYNERKQASLSSRRNINQITNTLMWWLMDTTVASNYSLRDHIVSQSQHSHSSSKVRPLPVITKKTEIQNLVDLWFRPTWLTTLVKSHHQGHSDSWLDEFISRLIRGAKHSAISLKIMKVSSFDSHSFVECSGWPRRQTKQSVL